MIYKWHYGAHDTKLNMRSVSIKTREQTFGIVCAVDWRKLSGMQHIWSNTNVLKLSIQDINALQ